MKKIAVSTWCTDDYAVHLRPDKLKKLVNHFHPEIDFHIVDTAQTEEIKNCLLYTSPSPRDLSTSRMPSSA